MMDQGKFFPVFLILLLPLSSSSIKLFPVPMQFVDYMNESASADPNLVERRVRLPGLDHVSNDEDLGHYAGYFKLPRSYDARLFYYFFESRNKNKDAPVLAWFNGGPACSSSVAVFNDNGPFRIENNQTLSWNEFGWDQVSNIIYVDQPIGTGFSYSSDKRDISRCSDDEVVNDLYDFLQAFFKQEHPELATNEFYIAGKSYAGHINPALATRIIQGNRVKEGLHINLKGIAMGNVLINPAIEFQANADYALGMGMIQRGVYDQINKVLPMCEMGIKLCETDEIEACVPIYWFCINAVFFGILHAAGDVNHHDIRKKCVGGECYDLSNMKIYLNQESVKAALGVPKGLEFSVCNSRLDDMMLLDRMKNIQLIIPDLLDEGVKILVYAGEYSFYLNYLGNWRWVHAMEWSGQKNFITAPQVRFNVDGHDFGALKSYGPLTFLKVFEAGSFVSMDQPKAALEMMKRWIQGTL